MAYDARSNKIRRQEAVAMDELVKQFIKDMRLDKGLNKQRIAEVWSEVSGAGRYTMDVSFEKGVLYCTIASSMVRNHLYFQKEALTQAMNESLKKDELFIWDWTKGPCVRSIVLK